MDGSLFRGIKKIPDSLWQLAPQAWASISPPIPVGSKTSSHGGIGTCHRKATLSESTFCWIGRWQLEQMNLPVLCIRPLEIFFISLSCGGCWIHLRFFRRGTTESFLFPFYSLLSSSNFDIQIIIFEVACVFSPPEYVRATKCVGRVICRALFSTL